MQGYNKLYAENTRNDKGIRQKNPPLALALTVAPKTTLVTINRYNSLVDESLRFFFQKMLLSEYF